MWIKIKKFACLALAMALLAICSGCGESSPDTKDVSVSDLAAAADSVLGTSDSMGDAGASVVEGLIKLTESDYEDCVVKITVKGTSFDEYGIFKGKDANQASSIEEAVKTYIQMRIDTDMGYQPEELPKLENAEVRKIGSYVVYCILDDSSRSVVLSVVEQALSS